MDLIKKDLLIGCANITGGGLADNIKRVIPENLCAEINLNKIKPTEDHYKYIYQRKTETHYAFPMIKAKNLNIIDTNDQIDIKCSNISEEKDKSSRKVKGDKCGIILDKTTFYHEAGGQVGDKGILVGPNGATFEVEDCQKLEGTNLVLHLGSVTKGIFNLFVTSI